MSLPLLGAFLAFLICGAPAWAADPAGAPASVPASSPASMPASSAASEPATQPASKARSRIVWVQGQPQLQIEVSGVPADTKDLAVAVVLNPQPTAESEKKPLPPLLTNPAVRLPWDKDGGKFSGAIELGSYLKAKGPHHVEVRVERADLDLWYWEDLHFSAENQPVQAYSLRSEGQFPHAKIAAAIWLAPVNKPNVKTVDFGLVVRDLDENIILDRLVKADVAPAGSYHEILFSTPATAVGPFVAELKVENDSLPLSFNGGGKFASANALVPVTSFEADDGCWRATDGELPVAMPQVSYDANVFHSGRQSLRIDYRDRPAVVYGDRMLPGVATGVRLWVKGNGTSDRLFINYHDTYDLTRVVWNRFPNTSRTFVCSLDFTDWRCFRVGALGDGLAIRSLAGSTPAIDAPVFVAGFDIEAGPGRSDPNVRSIWLDDLSAETQARPDERLTMELAADTADQLLNKNAKVFVAIGNGCDQELEESRLHLVAKDANGQAVQETGDKVTVPAGGFAFSQFSLGEAFDKSPQGPVDVDVSFVAPAVAGLRKAGRVTFKDARSYGLVQDFEQDETYSGYRGGKGAATVAGGAEGSGRCLRMEVLPNTEDANRYKYIRGGPPRKNSCIVHPSLPGLVDRIEIMVKGGPAPVTLQPILVDSGLTGDSSKDYNAFYLPAIEVNWQDWRKVELVAPAIPAFYGEKGRFFMNQPFYPLNLVFAASPGPEGAASEVFIDRIRVKTHLPPAEELRARIIPANDWGVYPPGAPLLLELTNLSAAEKKLHVEFSLDNFQGRDGPRGAVDVTVPPGLQVVKPLAEALSGGLYSLHVKGLEDQEINDCLQVVDAKGFFGDQPREMLASIYSVRKSLGMLSHKLYLDWDNVEGAPGLFHFNWFNETLKKAQEDGPYDFLPVLGFSPDWAGPSSAETIARNEYSRFIGNNLQVPLRMVDWSEYVRQVLREYKGRFSRWVFWENADLDGPQGIAPAKYAQMLQIVKKWVTLYDPNAKIVTGGFNMDKVLDYLESAPKSDELPFDEITVQMNLGELSPERADVESLLDEMGDLLALARTGRKINLVEMDWPVGKYVSPAQQAAYHSRATLILNSRGVAQHQFDLLNSGHEFPGNGIFYRMSFGNSECLQTLKNVFAPKPAFFALMQARKFLAAWQFVASVPVPDRDSGANRAYVYKNAQGRLAAAVWRTGSEGRPYRMPSGWQGSHMTDAFGFDIPASATVNLTELPSFIELPPQYAMGQLLDDLRRLVPSDGKDAVLLSLQLAEEDSCRRAGYSCTGTTQPQSRYGRLAGERKLRTPCIEGLTGEQFEFQLEQAGDVILTRGWYFDGKGQSLTLQCNDGPQLPWDLSVGYDKQPGLRQSTFVLRNCRQGKNVVKVGYASPGNCFGYRVEPLADNYVDLPRWGVLGALQTKGELQKHRSVSGTPLKIGKTQYATGLGSHAVALIEYPIDGQFSSFEVTVGVDAVTDGRGTVTFEVLVDGQQKAASAIMNGFSKPVTLKVDGLEKAKRLVLVVKDGGDGNQDDLADWVEGKLFLK